MFAKKYIYSQIYGIEKKTKNYGATHIETAIRKLKYIGSGKFKTEKGSK